MPVQTGEPMDSFGIILNVKRPDNHLTPVDLAIVRETIRLVVSYDANDDSFKNN
jgi:hypothetical protein